MRMLRSVLNFAQATYGVAVLPTNPVASLTAKRAWLRSNVRTDHLRTHEIKPFVDALRTWENPVLGAYLEFVLLTGARRREAATLRWKDIDTKAGVLTFKDTENHTDRLMPITPRIGELLDAMKELKMGEYIFATMGKDGKPTHLSEPRKALASANAAAGSVVTTHGLRRTYATVLESLDCPAYPLKALLGHSMKNDVTTAHYTQITVERLRPWAEKYEQFISKLIGDTESAKVVTLCKQAVTKPNLAAS
jgi:integrase